MDPSVEPASPLKNKLLLALLLGAPLPVLLISLAVGPSTSIPPAAVFRWMSGLLLDHETVPAAVHTIVMDVRLPRILLTLLVGAALSCSGAALQAVFRNPLVSSSILGIQSGAACGAALALSLPWLPLHPSAFAGGLLAVGTSYALARHQGTVVPLHLVLAGVVVSAMGSALLVIIQFLADPFRLQAIVHWTMGNLHTASWSKLASAWWLMLGGMSVLLGWRWRMNALALGDDEALAVGIHPERERMVILGAATLATSAAVAAAGVIGMVCLVVPHLVRMLVGADNRRCIPVSMTFGGAFLVLIDDVSRSIASFEIPIGVFTTLLGGPFFIVLLKRTRLMWVDG